MTIKILKGNIIHAPSSDKLSVHKDSFLVSNDGKIEGVYQEIPEKYKDIDISDKGNSLIIPSFCDMHLHASQFYQRGIGMDRPLLDWLETYTFPNEARFSDSEYARRVYEEFIEEIIRHGTLSCAIFATVHYEATHILLELLEKKGINAFVGKLNMDNNCPDYIREDTMQSYLDTERFIVEHKDYQTAKPIITPRFSPSCTEDLHQKLGLLADKYNTPVQSHLCESIPEIEWVKQLFPSYKNYGEVYAKNRLLGNVPTLMAHCIELNDDEIELMKNENCIAVHCPDSNINVSSGIMPAEYLMRNNIKVALGSDIGGGHSVALYRTMASAIQTSKARKYAYNDSGHLTVAQVLYMATTVGGSFFGRLGNFNEGYDFTALVIDDSNICGFEMEPEERLERFLYIGDDRNIKERYIKGVYIAI
ncbi:amidohydrolase family protein [Clostridium malenominatum]|uniref:Amidohydrolase family protein n=1 Tax=Clostridium malenominatum TaxID=1539 RepID=A0ABN1IL90_9CLOT